MNIDELALKLSGGKTLEDLRREMGGAVAAVAAQVDKTDVEVEYWKKVFDTKAPEHPLTFRFLINQEMDYSDARRKVWALLELRAAHLIALGNESFKWEFSEEQKGVIQNMIRYFINDKACQWPLNKGLFIYGAPGTGKTEIMRVMERFTRENNLSKTFIMSSLSEDHIKFKSDQAFDPITQNVMFNRCFDEFCRHVGPVQRFGESLDINESIIELREARHKRYCQFTHFIANATPNDSKDYFSPMVYDRLRSMCTSVLFKGTSKRG